MPAETWFSKFAWHASVLASGMIGCEQSTPPADLRIEFPERIVSADPAAVVVQLTSADGVRSRGTGAYEFSVVPPDLAIVHPRGMVTCQKSGDGTLKVSVASVSKSVPLRCRLVDRIEVSDLKNVELSSGPFVPKVRVLSEGGQELGDVEFWLNSKSPGVIVPTGNQLAPKDVGTAIIVARAGQVAHEFKVEVVRRVTPEVLPIDGNRRIHLSLSPGKYRLTVKLSSPRALSVEWRGAPYCNTSATDLEHSSTCVLRTKGAVVFDNPAHLLTGSTEISIQGVSLYEVP